MTIDKDKLRQIAEQCAMPYPADSIQFKTICLLADNENKPMSAAFIAEFLGQDNKAVHNALRYPVNHGNLIREKDGDFWKYSLPKEPRKLCTKTTASARVEQPAKDKPIKSATPPPAVTDLMEGEPMAKEVMAPSPQTWPEQQEAKPLLLEDKDQWDSLPADQTPHREASGFAAKWCSRSGFSVSKAGATVELDENDLDTLLRLYVHMRGGLPNINIVETGQ